ncbi:long-chain-fatty-acid--CoA ligase [Corynebacterium alimapuense]|uniref:Long-chain fatty acid--CoA ligase n=1 Tax=Corynebacterium alimapuense TaxID=1576874 RepID=A0A3M8KBX1_9CORY|nr:long-chain-fatty-acid--CoA ligase [Corynebacterium alimapuense]RNE50032.1 long-chain fatty acid--CoA ligase [Corynebacterium alimapuense]
MVHLADIHTLRDSLRHHSATRPQHIAVMTPAGPALTYQQLDENSSLVAGKLAGAGVGEGDRIAYIGKELPSYWESLFACVKLGAVLVPVDWRLTPPEVEHILDDSTAGTVIIDPDHLMAGKTGLQEISSEPQQWAQWRDATSAELTEAARAAAFELDFIPGPDTAMAQLYTSGTTGLPKGVILAHRSWFAVRDALYAAHQDWITIEEGDICYVGIAGFHIGGLWYATQVFNAGQTVFSAPEFRPDLAREHFRVFGITNAILVPAMMASIAQITPADPAAFTKLRQVVYGGAPISDAVLEECIRVFDARFAQIYGLTETGNTACCLPPDQHYPGSPRLKAAGHPYPSFEARVVDREGRILPAHGIGEVQLKTPARMLGYWNRPEATAETLVDGWIHTGDAGYIDDEGYVFIQDRFKDMILVGGENVFPAEIERAIIRHPGVHDAAVIGVPDERSGEAVRAFVLAAPGKQPTTRELMMFLKDHLAPFKRPTQWEFSTEIPRNPSGKILRRKLRESHWSGRERQVN